MGRRLQKGITSSSQTVPQTISIVDNIIATVAENTNLNLRPTGSGVVDVTAMQSSGPVSVTSAQTYTQDQFNTGAAAIAGDVSVAGKQQISGSLRVNGTSTFIGNATFTADAGFNTLNVSGLATFNELAEITQSKTGATGVVEHDYSGGGIFFHSSISDNFTANFTNVPTTADRAYAMVLVLNQGASGRIPNAVQINSSAETIRWANGVTPSAGTNRIDIATFTLIRISGTWYVVGNYTNYA